LTATLQTPGGRGRKPPGVHRLDAAGGARWTAGGRRGRGLVCQSYCSRNLAVPAGGARLSGPLETRVRPEHHHDTIIANKEYKANTVLYPRRPLRRPAAANPVARAATRQRAGGGRRHGRASSRALHQTGWECGERGAHALGLASSAKWRGARATLLQALRAAQSAPPCVHAAGGDAKRRGRLGQAAGGALRLRGVPEAGAAR
jgi:hypothetical protein